MKTFIKIFFSLIFLPLVYSATGVGQTGYFSNISSRTDKSYLDSLYFIADTTLLDTVKAINYLKISSVLDLNNHEKFNEKSGKDYFNMAKQIAVGLHKQGLFVAAVDNIAVRNRRNGFFKKALRFHLAALSLVDSLNKPRLKSIILNNIGVVFRRIDDYQDALNYHLKALHIADSLGDLRTKSMAINSIGNVYVALEKYNDALNSFRKSLSLEYNRNNKLGIAINLNNIGSVYQALGNLNKAYEYYKLSLDVNTEINSQKGIGICNSDIGSIFYAKKFFHRALKQYYMAEAIFLKTGDKIYLANTFLMIGKTMYQMDSIKNAEKYLLMAKDIAVSIGSKVVTEKTYKWLSKAYQKSNDYKKALYYIELSNNMKDSINNIAIQKNIIRMQIKYDLENKENEIVLLHHQQKINVLELKKQKTANLLMLLGIILIFITMVFLIYYIHVRNQKNRILEEKNREIEQARVELKKYAEDLLVAKHQAEKSSKTKSEFLANMSHEFRTPLSSVIGFVDLLLSREQDVEKRDKLKLIQSSSKSLLLLLTDILDLSKVESGKLKIDYEPVDVVRVVDEVYQMFKINTERKGVRFNYVVQERFPKNLLLSELRLRQVLFNLIGNAVKFTKSGEIIVEVNHTVVDDAGKAGFSISVKDTGKGIMPEDIEKIFEPFVQLDAAGEYQGTGLGLAITRQIVDSMGGKLTVSSEPGVGSSFIIIFKELLKADAELLLKKSKQKEHSDDKTDVNVVIFTNNPDDCGTLFDFLSLSVSKVKKVVNSLSDMKKLLPDTDLLVLCCKNESILTNTYRVLSQSRSNEALRIVIISESEKVIKSLLSPKHIVVSRDVRMQQEMLMNLIFDINADKLFGELSGCISKLHSDDAFKIYLMKNVIPLFNIASETKLMNNFSSFSMAIDKLAAEYNVSVAANFARYLKQSIKKFDINEIEKLLNYFKTNCIDTIVK